MTTRQIPPLLPRRQLRQIKSLSTSLLLSARAPNRRNRHHLPYLSVSRGGSIKALLLTRIRRAPPPSLRLSWLRERPQRQDPKQCPITIPQARVLLPCRLLSAWRLPCPSDIWAMWMFVRLRIRVSYVCDQCVCVRVFVYTHTLFCRACSVGAS